MPFTDAPPSPPVRPTPPNVWFDKDGRPTQAAEDYFIKLDEYHRKLTVYLTAMAAAIP